MFERVSAGQSLRAVVAARLSRVHANATGDESQSLNGHEYAKARKWKVVGEASDLDVSAIKIDPWKRPELSYWLNHPELFDVLIFRSIDRVARKMFDFMDLLRWADTHSIRLVCLDMGEGIDFGTPEGRMVSLGLAYAAEIEGKKITDRTTGARKYMRRVGRWGAGKAPYGYRLAAHPDGKGYSLEPDPDTAPVVHEIVERVIAGGKANSFRAIVRDLNNAGVPSPLALRLTPEKLEKRGGENPKWAASTLSHMLTSWSLRAYVTHQGKIQRHTDGDEVGQPIMYGEPLLDAVTFNQLQDAIKGIAAPQGPRSHTPRLLGGVVQCGRCDGPLYYSVVPRYSRKDKGGAPDGRTRIADVHVYRCQNRKGRETDCKGGSINVDIVEPWVEAEFLRRVGNRSTVIRTIDPGESHATELAEIEDAIAELQADRQAGLYRSQRGTEDFRRQYAALDRRREILSAKPDRPASVVEVETGISYAHEWELSDTQARNALLRNAGVVVTVSPAVRGPGGVDSTARLAWDMRGPEHLRAKGYDDPNADENFAN